MTIWLLLALEFLVQEPISTSAVLLTAYQDHYNVWLIHLLFSAATIFDIVVGYYIGYVIRKKFSNTKLIIALKTRLEAFSEFIGEKGKIVALVVYAPIIFPISAILVPWLDVSFAEALIYIFIGEWIFWYGFEWLLVLGAKTFIPNPYTALYSVLIIAAIITLGLKFILKKQKPHANKSH